MGEAPDGGAVRVGLVAPRPLPPSLLTHAEALVRRWAPDVAVHDTSRPGSWSVALAGALDRDLAGGPPAEEVAELRAPATALGVDSTVLTGDLATHGPGLVVLDVDSTLITAEVVELIAAHAGTRDAVAAVTERAMRGELDFAASLRERVATFAGLDAAALEAVRGEAELSAGAVELVAGLHGAGCRVGVVSGGFAEVVGPIADELGLDHWAANVLEVEGGRLTGRTTGPVVDRAAKAEHLRAWAEADGVAPGRVVAVGDGANDLDMLAAAGLGVAYLAKPLVLERSDAAITFPRLDALLGLLGR